MRIGEAGNIYSFRGAYGEAMPPQVHEKAPWIDETMQSVSVNHAKNQPGSSFFIHQAGTYMKDSPYTDDNPFFSPSVAKYCSGNTCSFASWGQQAHLPTRHKSEAIYFNSYSDCGNGVVEFTSGIHNGETGSNNGDLLEYFNVPWTGVRDSVLKDVLVANKNTQELKETFPVEVWPALSHIKSVKDLGGFITYAEDIETPPDEVDSIPPYRLPCFDQDTGNAITCTDSNYEVSRMRLIILNENGCRKSDGHTNTYGMYFARVEIESTFIEKSGCRYCNLQFENANTGEIVVVPHVLHFAWAGNELYFNPTVTATEFNTIFKKGDEIIVSYSSSGKPAEENRALTFVFGSPTLNHHPPNRIRYGKTGNMARDTQIFVSIRKYQTRICTIHVHLDEVSLRNVCHLHLTICSYISCVRRL